MISPEWKRPLEFLAYALIFFYSLAQFCASEDLAWAVAAWCFGLCAYLTVKRAMREGKP